MRKMCSILLAVLLLSGVLAGCGGQRQAASDDGADGTLSVVTTIFPEYDWVMHILGDRATDTDVTMLLDTGVDLHSYQPTADDMIRISTCDLFIYVGGASDSWVDDALKTAVNKDMIVLDLMQLLGDAVRKEEVVEGMQTDDHHTQEEQHAEEPEYDEHIWLSLKNAAVLCAAIRDALIELDAPNAEVYSANAEAYLEKLNELDGRYRDMVAGAERRIILFGDRFPFRYLADDYGLTYYAAFAGCSAETEASFETVAFLAEKVCQEELPVILTLEGTDHRLAETVAAASGVQSVEILSVNSMQSVTARDVQTGDSYLSIMENNLSVLQQALW